MPQHPIMQHKAFLHLRHQTFLTLPCTFFSKCSGALQRKYMSILALPSIPAQTRSWRGGGCKNGKLECLSQEVEDSLALGDVS